MHVVTLAWLNSSQRTLKDVKLTPLDSSIVRQLLEPMWSALVTFHFSKRHCKHFVVTRELWDASSVLQVHLMHMSSPYVNQLYHEMAISHCRDWHTPALISCLLLHFQLCLLSTNPLRLFHGKPTCFLSPTKRLCIPPTCCHFCPLWIISPHQPSANPTCFPLLTSSLRFSSWLHWFSPLLSTSEDARPWDGACLRPATANSFGEASPHRWQTGQPVLEAPPPTASAYSLSLSSREENTCSLSAFLALG